MARVKTFAGSGSILPGDLNSMQDDYERTFTQWRTFLRRAGVYSYTLSAKQWLGPIAPTLLANAAIYADSTDLTAALRVARWRLRLTAFTNATVAPGASFTLGLDSITTTADGTITASSQALPVVAATPVLSSLGSIVTATGEAPAASSFAGQIALYLTRSATSPPSGSISYVAELQYRQV